MKRTARSWMIMAVCLVVVAACSGLSEWANEPVGGPTEAPNTDTGGTGGDTDDTMQKIEQLKQLRDSGAITEAEYQAKKKELLDRL